MSAFDLPSPEVFTTGAIGPPGQRVFYLQARDGDLVVTVKCEKQQVAALAEYFDGLLSDLEPVPYAVRFEDLELAEPADALWTVGRIGVAYDKDEDRIVVVLEEPEEDDEATVELEPDGSGSLTVRLTRAQVSGFVERSRAVVAAGRPPCRLCGLPMDPDGHPCPRLN